MAVLNLLTETKIFCAFGFYPLVELVGIVVYLFFIFFCIRDNLLVEIIKVKKVVKRCAK